MAICVHPNFRAISARDGPTNSNEGSVRKNPLNLSRLLRIYAPAIPAIWGYLSDWIDLFVCISILHVHRLSVCTCMYDSSYVCV